jgi:hypothetical protein
MLTGESIPVDANRGSAVYAGSLVRRGQAVAEVTATGSKTYFGRAAGLVRVAHAASTKQGAIFGVTRNLAVVNGAVAVLIIAYAYAIALPSTDLVRLSPRSHALADVIPVRRTDRCGRSQTTARRQDTIGIRCGHAGAWNDRTPVGSVCEAATIGGLHAGGWRRAEGFLGQRELGVGFQ